MGRFEDLVETAKSGNLEALDALQSEFGGSNLREKAERVGVLEKEAEALLGPARRGKFEEMRGQLTEDLRSNVSIEDLGEVHPNEITTDLLKEKAQANVKQREDFVLAAAKAAGFESVEEYQKALDIVKQQNTERRAKAETIAGGASGAGQSSGGDGKDPFDKAKEDYDKAMQTGSTEDVALGEFVETLLAQQAPTPTRS